MRKAFIYSLMVIFMAFSVSLSAQVNKSGKGTQTKTTDKTNKGKGTAIKDNKGGTKTVDKTPVNAGKGKTEFTLTEVSKNSTPVIEQKQNGDINWSAQYIEARGSSVVDNERFKLPAQARAMAIRGAIVIAQRNLLEIINGVNVTSETIVQDMIATSDYVYTRVDGLVKGAQQVGEPIEKDGMIEVTMRIPIYAKDGLAPIVYNQLPASGKGNGQVQITEKSAAGGKDAQQTGKGAADKSGTQSIVPEGLAFNFNGKTYDPAMFPVVADEQGNILLDLSTLYDPNTGQFPQILQTTKDVFNLAGFDKGTAVIDVLSSKDGKIVIDNKNSKKFDWTKLTKVVSTVGDVLKFVLAIL
ncbi:MAG: hypothetical protein WCM76_15475 [Bacteroidota bacterium]